MRPELKRSASPSPETSSAKAKAVLESRRVRSSFSFDPMAVAPLFQGMAFAIDIDSEDVEFVDEIAKLITRLGGTVVRINKMDSSTILIWRRGDIENLERVDELKSVAIGQKWIFDCIERNERLSFDKYLVSKSEREDAQLRKELGIKRQGKTKRASVGVSIKNKSKLRADVEGSKQKARASSRIEKAFKNKDMGAILKGMADTIKEFCEDDPDLKNMMNPDMESVCNQSLERTQITVQEDSRSKLKRVKRNDQEISTTKRTIMIPASSFLRCLQNEKNKMILYQGNFNLLQGLIKMKTEDGCQVAFMKADRFSVITTAIDLFIILKDSVNSLGLLYAILKKINIVNEDFLQACLNKGKILSLSTHPQYLLNPIYEKLKKEIFFRTTFKVQEPPEQSKETDLKVWTAKYMIEQLGGRISEVLSLVDIVVVLSDDEGNFVKGKSLEPYTTYLIQIVNERWLVDSVLAGSKLPGKEPKYEINPDPPETKKKLASKPIATSLKAYFQTG
jgi:hypothetical protein